MILDESALLNIQNYQQPNEIAPILQHDSVYLRAISEIPLFFDLFPGGLNFLKAPRGVFNKFLRHPL